MRSNGSTNTGYIKKIKKYGLDGFRKDQAILNTPRRCEKSASTEYVMGHSHKAPSVSWTSQHNAFSGCLIVSLTAVVS